LFEIAFIIQSFGESLTDFGRNIRIVDILDISIITFFLYVVLNWLRQSASRRSLLTIFVLIAVYFLARITGMYLTELLIEGIFIIILIGTVVIFQSDMRRIFDRMSSWTFFNSSSSSPKPSSDIATSIITEASAKMAENKTGALIVIKGKESWERHMHGGIELNGQITIPLLHSIFNKHAPGHDGAVLLEGTNITKFGVHLPLSTNLYKMSRGGTRHTAALGISEQCDAFVVVVSEERGAISVAQNAQLEELDSSSDLKKHLDSFWAEHYGDSSTSLTHWWKRPSILTALGAAALSITFWLAFVYPWETAIRSYEVPIEFRNLQSTNIILQDSVPSKANIRISGSEQAFRTLEPSDLIISFDLAGENISEGGLEISEDDINLPTDVRLFEAVPSVIKLSSTKLSAVELPVRVPTSGTLRSGLELISVKADPAAVKLLADTTASVPDSVATEIVDLSTIQNSAAIQKRLLLENDSVQISDSTSAQVLVRIEVRKGSQ
jgi:uncharacterized protein (TIGR00159 family)